MKYPLGLLLIVVLAILFRIFVAEFYYIPSTSMSSTLLVGDYIMVNKTSYGATLLKNPADIPIISIFMYCKPFRHWLVGKHWKYYRMPGFGKPKRNDIIVFKSDNNIELIIKRCLATPGDTFRIDHDKIYVNNQLQTQPEFSRLNYSCRFSSNFSSENSLRRILPRKDFIVQTSQSQTLLALTSQDFNSLSKYKMYKKLNHTEDTLTSRYKDYFPNCPHLKWNSSHYGPIIIPRKGTTIPLDTANLMFYRKLIVKDENNDIRVDGKDIYINGAKTNHYTFKMDYYFMIGDNRLCSYDSRFLGFISEDKIIGKATYIIFSKENDPWGKPGIRWDRIFNSI